MKIVITGGHHTSAIPVIKRLKERYPSVEVVWFGHKYSQQGNKNVTLEFSEITALNIPFHNLTAGKLYKTYNLKRLFKIPVGVIHAFYLLIKTKPDVILSFGGYLAAPTVIAGFFLRIPSVTHEQTMVTGYAQTLISYFAKKVLVSWPQSVKYFQKKKTVITGIPLRDEIYKSASNSFMINSQLPTVYITAGKEGSHKINLAVKSALKKLLSFCNIIHQCGNHSAFNDFDLLNLEYEKIKSNVSGKYFTRKFVLEDEIGEAFNKADLVMMRAGAHTIAEVIVLQKPSLVIPIPWVSHNEQMINAQALCDSGLGIILEERQLNNETLVNLIRHIVKHKDQMKLKDIKLKEYLQKDSTGMIITEVLSVANQKTQE